MWRVFRFLELCITGEAALVRSRQIVSSVVGILAIFTVGRVIVAYATRPSRWSARFSTPFDACAIGDTISEVRSAPESVSHNHLASAGAEGEPLSAAFAGKGADDVAEVTQVRAAMLSAIRAGDASAYAAYFASAAVSFTAAGVAIVGRDALEEATRWALSNVTVGHVVLEGVTWSFQAGAIVEQGRFGFVLYRGEVGVAAQGRFAAVWRREFGNWRIVFEAVRTNENERIEA